MIRHDPKTGITIDPEDRQHLDEKFNSMSPSQRRRYGRKNPAGLGFMDAIVWFMCRHKLDAQRATEMMIEQLKRGDIAMEGKTLREIRYPASFWRELGENQFHAAYGRGFWTKDEIAMLWRHLRREDPPPEHLKFPDLPGFPPPGGGLH